MGENAENEMGRVWVKMAPMSQTRELGFYAAGSKTPGEDFREERQMTGSVLATSDWRLG